MKSFDEIAAQMRRMEMPLPAEKVQVQIPDAENVLREGLSYFLKQESKDTSWLPEYEQIAEWLSGNEGRGLFMYGHCGRGKSLLGRYVLPAILLGHSQRAVSVFDTNEMNLRLDHVLTRHIISLDDIGTEEISNTYGNKRMAFSEIMDAAEKHNKLLIISTNLSVDDIRERYGDRVLDRIKSMTKRVLFEGNSMRK